jgi:hypothetical protein
MTRCVYFLTAHAGLYDYKAQLEGYGDGDGGRGDGNGIGSGIHVNGRRAGRGGNGYGVSGGAYWRIGDGIGSGYNAWRYVS